MLHDVERVVALVLCDFDKGHAFSTAPVGVEMRTPLDIAKTLAAICRRYNPHLRIDPTPRISPHPQYKRLDSPAKAFAGAA
jgi:hypothetical protein